MPLRISSLDPRRSASGKTGNSGNSSRDSCTSAHRRAARRWAEVHESREELPEFPVFPEADRLGSRDEIRRGIACLSADQAEALLLHHEWGFSFNEIAGILGISPAAA